MPRQNPILDDSDFDSDDEGAVLDLEQKPTRKFEGDDDEVIDAETGEREFEDIDPRFRNAEFGDEEESEEKDDLEDEEPEEKDDPDSKDEVDEPEEDEDDERPRKNSRFRARLERERRLREEEQEENRDLRARLDRLEATQKLQASDETFERTKEGLATKIAAVREKLTAAVEAGETAQQVELTEELADLKGELRAATKEHEQAKAAAAEAAKNPPTDGIVARRVRQWIRKHPRFNSDPTFNALTKATDKQLVAEGLNPEDPEYYEELDKRLAKRYPEEYKAQRREAERNPRRHPSANIRRASDRGTRKESEGFTVKNGRVQLSPRQVKNMRTFGLNPADKSDVRAYYENNRPNRSR